MDVLRIRHFVFIPCSFFMKRHHPTFGISDIAVKKAQDVHLEVDD